MARELSVKRKKFVAALLRGKTQLTAYEEAGYAVNGKRETGQRNAKVLAHHPEVRAEIERLQVALMPDPGQMRELAAHARAVMVELPAHAEDEKVRYQAAEWLHAEAKEWEEKREKLEAAKREPREVEVVAQLRALYAKALPGVEPEPLVVEVSEE